MVGDVIRKSLVEVAELGQWNALRRAAQAQDERARAAAALRLTHETLTQLVITVYKKKLY